MTVPGTASPNNVRNSNSFLPGIGFLANKKPCNIPIAAASMALTNETNRLIESESQPVSLLKCSNVNVLLIPIIFTKAPSTTITNIRRMNAINSVLIVTTKALTDLERGTFADPDSPLIVPTLLSLRKYVRQIQMHKLDKLKNTPSKAT